jgi:NAD(P)-dependent dehydrogenase (short-subunit alcohol dehydrogenase family)
MALKGLSGKVAIVTGAASGIGAATAARLVDEGCKVVGADLKPVAGNANLHGVICDVSKEADVDACVQAAVSKFGGLDLLVNNAAYHGAKKPLADITPAEFDFTHAVNSRGVFLCLRAGIKQMVKQGRGGAIVSVASVGGIKSFPDLADYTSAKRAVVGLSGAAAIDYGKHGIRSNVVCPGSVDTPMLRAAFNLPPEMTAEQLAPGFANQPIARIGRPDEIAAMIAFLLSDEASYQTGGIYTVDGGNSL